MTLRGHNGPDGPEAVADLLTEVAVETLRDQYDAYNQTGLGTNAASLLTRRKAEREIARAAVALTKRGMIGDPRSEVVQANQTYAYKAAARVVVLRAIKTFMRLRSLRYDVASDRNYAARFMCKRAINYLCPTPYRVRPDFGLVGVNDSPGITLDAV
jgi:hypothetical protein